MSKSLATPPEPPDDRLSKLIDAVGQIARQQQSLIEALRPPAGGSSPTPAAGDLRSLVADAVREQSASDRRLAARDQYVREHLADLPEAYRRAMPQTDDPKALADAEQKVREQFRQDLKSHFSDPSKLRIKPADPSRDDAAAGDFATGVDASAFPSDDPGGQPPAAAIDYAKLSPMQQIALGLKSAGRTAVPARPTSRPGSRNADGDVRAPVPVAELEGEPLFVGAD